MNRKHRIQSLGAAFFLWLLLHQLLLGLELPGHFLGLPAAVLLESGWVLGGVAIVLCLRRVLRQRAVEVEERR